MLIPRILTAVSFLIFEVGNLCAKDSKAVVHVQQVEQTIAKIRSDTNFNTKMLDAIHLADLTKRISNKEVTEKLIADMISLLDAPDDYAVYWVARALGNLGPVAKAAVPRMLEMLPKADCVDGVITAAGGIRTALIQMGVKPPGLPNCTPRAAE